MKIRFSLLIVAIALLVLSPAVAAFAQESNEAAEWYAKGCAYLDSGDFANAEAAFKQALVLKPDYAQVYKKIVHVYMNRKQYDLAMASLNKAVELNPSDPGTYSSRAGLYILFKRYDLAIADGTKALTIDPRHAPAYYNRGLAYVLLKKYDQAIADFSAGLEINPQNSLYYYYRGMPPQVRKIMPPRSPITRKPSNWERPSGIFTPGGGGRISNSANTTRPRTTCPGSWRNTRATLPPTAAAGRCPSRRASANWPSPTTAKSSKSTRRMQKLTACEPVSTGA